MNEADRNELWRDALDDVAARDFQAASLERALAESRRVRRRRRVARAGVALAIVLATSFLTFWQAGNRPELRVRIATTSPVKARPAVKFLSDQDLFALFPGQPLALFGPADDRQLVFLDAPSDSMDAY